MKPIFYLLAAAAFPSWAAAAPICTPGTLESYLTLAPDGCTVGDSIFSEFASFDVPGALDVSPDQISVTPLGGPFSPVLEFGGPFAAAAGELFGVGFLYTVQGNFIANQAQLINAVAGLDGAVTLIEDKCFGQAFVAGSCAGPTDTLALFATEFASETSTSIGLPNLTTLGIRNELVVDGGLAGSASLDFFRNELSAVPEPSSVWLLVLGAVALGALRRKAVSSRSNHPTS